MVHRLQRLSLLLSAGVLVAAAHADGRAPPLSCCAITGSSAEIRHSTVLRGQVGWLQNWRDRRRRRNLATRVRLIREFDLRDHTCWYVIVVAIIGALFPIVVIGRSDG